MSQQRHIFTAEEGGLGVKTRRLARKEELRFRKKLAQIQTQAQLIDLLKAGLASPVISGVVAYGVVTAFEKLGAAASQVATSSPGNSSTPAQAPGLLQAIENLFVNVTSAQSQLANPIGALAGVVGKSLPAIEITALKGAIILYIASGGNLAGLLASGGNAFSGIIGSLTKVLGPAAEAAAVA